MRGKKAKEVRKLVYGDKDHRDRSYDTTLMKVVNVKLASLQGGERTIQVPRYKVTSDMARMAYQHLKRVA